MISKIGKFIKKNALTIILAILPPLVIWLYFQKESSDINVAVISSVPVISLESEFSEDVVVLYKNKSVESLYVTDIRITNNGNKPIDKTDFDHPLQIDFNGEVISPVEVVSTIPKNLPVKTTVSKDTLTISPLLLNAGDSFLLRSKVASPKDNKLSISASGRIKGIQKIDFKPFSEQEGLWQSFGLGVLSSILVAISIIAFATLFRKFKLVSISLPGITLDLSRQIESEAKISKRVEELAERLEISHYDYKSNVLLLRLKIENQLRELARKTQLDTRTNIGSIVQLSRKLSSARIIDTKIVSLIQDISPAMNRELHESESYLSESEFEALQHAALSVIAAIEKADENVSGNEENA